MRLENGSKPKGTLDQLTIGLHLYLVSLVRGRSKIRAWNINCTRNWGNPLAQQDDSGQPAG